MLLEVKFDKNIRLAKSRNVLLISIFFIFPREDNI